MEEALTTTVADCSLRGVAVSLRDLPNLSSDEIALIVGLQEPGANLLDARDYEWQFAMLSIRELENSNEDGEPPDGGWKAAHERHIQCDLEAVANGSPEYLGRAEWLRDVWGLDTRIYPVFVSYEDGAYRVWDGYRRLAGAFYYDINLVAVMLGTPRNV